MVLQAHSFASEQPVQQSTSRERYERIADALDEVLRGVPLERNRVRPLDPDPQQGRLPFCMMNSIPIKNKNKNCHQRLLLNL